MEDLLAEQTGEEVPSHEQIPFSKRWAGKMKLAGKKDVRYRKLAKKHSLAGK